MKVLGLDTATHTGGVAIVVDDRVVGAAQTSPEARAADLLVTVDQVFREAELTARALDAVAIGVGPGSFTGLRIGMATAKGIAFAVGCPLWGVSSLHALAHDAGSLDRTASPFGAAAGRGQAPTVDGLIVAALDARRGEIYAGCYVVRDGAAVSVAAERVLPPADFEAWIAAVAVEVGAARVTCVGDARTAHRALGGTWLEHVTTPSGAAVAQLAIAGARVDILVGGVPSYIRLAEAEVKYPDGVPGALRRH